MFIQQLIGTINLALPAIILFQFYPDGVFGLYGMIILSMLTGVYVRYLNKKSAHTMVASLLYRPTGDYDQAFRHLISECEIDPATITINYAYTNQVVAMTIFTTLIIDPLVWSSVEEDPEALKVKEIYDKAIEPKLSLIQKKRLHEIKQALTPGAQRFIQSDPENRAPFKAGDEWATDWPSKRKNVPFLRREA